MTIGQAGKNGVRTSQDSDAQAIINVFLDHGHTELDTARVYAGKKWASIDIVI